MWLLLEYDRILQAQAMDALNRAGVRGVGVDREEQLGQVDKPQVDLLLVGAGWQKATVEELREAGMSAPSVYVTSHMDVADTETAHDLGCVDAVTYPLPVTYLERWARSREKDEGVGKKHDESVAVTPLDEILHAKQALGKKHTYTRVQGKVDTEPAEGTNLTARGRVVVLHSAQGGVGKSVLTSALARYMADRNYAVVMLDLDPKGKLLAMHRSPVAVTVDDWARLPAQMDEGMLKQSLTRAGDVYLLPSGKQRDGVDVATFRRMVFHLSQYFDLVLIDTAPSLPSTYAALTLAHQVVFVMTPEWTALKRCIDEYEAIRHQKGTAHVTFVVNRIRRRALEHMRTLRLIDEAKVQSDMVHVPEDKRLHNELNNARSLIGGRDFTDSLAHLCSALRFDPVLDDARKSVKRRRRVR